MGPTADGRRPTTIRRPCLYFLCSTAFFDKKGLVGNKEYIFFSFNFVIKVWRHGNDHYHFDGNYSVTVHILLVSYYLVIGIVYSTRKKYPLLLT